MAALLPSSKWIAREVHTHNPLQAVLWTRGSGLRSVTISLCHFYRPRVTVSILFPTFPKY
jgi:hypothetical protein